jgi:hypothetical protein
MTMAKIRTAGLSLAALIAAMTISAPPGFAAGAGQTVGEQRRWTLDFRVRLEQPGGQAPVEVDLGGELVSTVSSVRTSEYDAAIEVAGARVTGRGVTDAPAGAQEELRRRLGRRFWATYSNDGTLLAVHFYKDVNPSDRNLLQMILTEAQFVRPEAGEPVYTIIERDGAGSYLAIYQQGASDDVVKRKLKYVETDGVAGASATGVRVAVDGSELHFSFAPDGEMKSLDGTDRVSIGLTAGEGGQLAAITEVHLTNLRRGRAAELIGSLAAARPEVVSSPVLTHRMDPEEQRALRDQRLLEGRSTTSLLEAAISPEGEEMLSDRLAALFRRRPEAVREALALLKTNGPQKRITEALGAAGSAAATDALVRLAGDKAAPESQRVDALTALAQTARPSEEAMAVPAALLDDADVRVASAARLMAGAMARAGRATHAKVADAIDAALIERCRKSVEAAEMSNLLGALGNSASPAALAVVEGSLRDPRATVRGSAVRALRLGLGAEVDDLLSGAITGDPDANVRVGAIFAASFRPAVSSPLTASLLEAARKDASATVRSSAISLLRRNVNASPQVAGTLGWIAENDAKPGIRRQAREALASVQAGTMR